MGADLLQLRSTAAAAPLLRPRRSATSTCKSNGAMGRVPSDETDSPHTDAASAAALPDWITCAEDLTGPPLPNTTSGSVAPASYAACASALPVLPPAAATPRPSRSGRSRRGSESSGCLRTSMEIFMRHVRERADGTVDASGIMSKACFREWVASRKNKLKNPHLTFVHTVRSHVTGERKTGRNPFPAKVEADLLTLFRQRRVWPCFEGSGVKYGIRGMFVTGYHEGRGTLPPAGGDNNNNNNNNSDSQQQQQQQQQRGGQAQLLEGGCGGSSPFAAMPLLESLGAAPGLEAQSLQQQSQRADGNVKLEAPPTMERMVSWQTMPRAMTEPLAPPPMPRTFDNFYCRETSTSQHSLAAPTPTPTQQQQQQQQQKPQQQQQKQQKQRPQLEPLPLSTLMAPRQASMDFKFLLPVRASAAHNMVRRSQSDTEPLDAATDARQLQLNSSFAEELVELLSDEDEGSDEQRPAASAQEAQARGAKRASSSVPDDALLLMLPLANQEQQQHGHDSAEDQLRKMRRVSI